VSRYFALPIASATIIPGKYFSGRVLAPGADPEASPEAEIAVAEALCEQAQSLMPAPGESQDDAAPWIVHVRARCIELLAGREAERIAFGTAALSSETDIALARIFAASICAPGAIDTYLGYAGSEAREILKRWWHIRPG
jgi:hypothetical protein